MKTKCLFLLSICLLVSIFPQNNNYSHPLKIGNRVIPFNTYNLQSPIERQLETVKNLLIDDFLVNDDTLFGSYQGNPSISTDGAGNFVIVWEDQRNGYYSIYYQLFNSTEIEVGVKIREKYPPPKKWEVVGTWLQI